MITVKGTKIRVPQGESGAVIFAFKNSITDYPYILKTKMNETDDAAILFEIKSSANPTGNVTLSKYFYIDNEDSDWYRFSTTEIMEAPASESDMIPGILYYRYINDAVEFIYKKTADGVTLTYDYTNSSIAVNFDREDTLNLVPKTYFYEISYIEGNNLGMDNEKVTLKTTLLEPCEFTVSRAVK